MNTVTANARKLLNQKQQQQNHIRMGPPPPPPSRPTSTSNVDINECLRLVQEVPSFKGCLELSYDFIQMGNSMLAQAYMSKCIQYMEHAKESLIQNMSQAGSVAGFDTRSNIVKPWIQRNQNFMNSNRSDTGMSCITNRTRPIPDSSFKRPLPISRPQVTSSNTLRPIRENTVSNIKNNYKTTSSSGNEINNIPKRRIIKRVIQSTPIRPDMDQRKTYMNINDENLFSTISPLKSNTSFSSTDGKKNVDERRRKSEDELLLTNYSPQDIQQQTNIRRKVIVKRIKKVIKPQQLLPPVTTTEEDNDTDADTTITKRGRISKPPKNYNAMGDNSILSESRHDVSIKNKDSNSKALCFATPPSNFGATGPSRVFKRTTPHPKKIQQKSTLSNQKNNKMVNEESYEDTSEFSD